MKIRLFDIIPFKGKYLLLIEKTTTPIKLKDTFDVIVDEVRKMQISNLKEFDDFPIEIEHGINLIAETDLRKLVRLQPRKNKTYLKLNEQFQKFESKKSTNLANQNIGSKKSTPNSFFLEECSPKMI